MQAVETRTIRAIPADQRHGRPRDLFTLWFGSNLMILTIVTGALCTTVFRLSFIMALVAIVAGNLFGGVFMALHAAQGPRLGVTQMVQTRGQFGVRGALAVIAVVAIMDIGFFASNLILAAQSVHSAIGVVPSGMAVLLVAILALLAAVAGHDMIHVCTRAVSWAAGVAIVASFFWICWHLQRPAALLEIGPVAPAALIGAISTGVLWQVAYAPFVSDYSRYMPVATGSRSAFFACYSGCVLGSILPMSLGALLGSLFPAGEAAASLTSAIGPLAPVVVPVLTLGICAASAICLYSGTLCIFAIIQTFVPSWRPGVRARIVLSVLVASLAIALALGAGPHFTQSYTDFIMLLLYVLIPWTAINLVDYYLIQDGDYDVPSFLQSDGGIYGAYNWPALACYGTGILVQLPFVSNGLHVGSVARALGGADLSWVVGLLVVAPLYYVLATPRRGVARI